MLERPRPEVAKVFFFFFSKKEALASFGPALGV
jgi:hypothetical protein